MKGEGRKTKKRFKGTIDKEETYKERRIKIKKEKKIKI